MHRPLPTDRIRFQAPIGSTSGLAKLTAPGSGLWISSAPAWSKPSGRSVKLPSADRYAPCWTTTAANGSPASCSPAPPSVPAAASALRASISSAVGRRSSSQ